jgi:2-keto-4-pentenoate hydratase/2-oxohepta-3-ene-1,7-dioic acid hydratase in catechol pathway
LKLALLRGGRGAEFAVGADGARWAALRSLGFEAPDTRAAIAAVAALDPARVEAAAALEGVTLGCPIVAPTKLLAVGLNYADHARETGTAPPPEPRLFAKLPNALTGPYDTVPLEHRITRRLDYEAELAVVIGRRTRDVSEADALGCVFGYAVANDLTARDVQERDGQPVYAKGFDGYGPIGPWITTADEVADPQALRVRSLVNGELRQDSSTAGMVFGVARLVHHAARGITLEVGDVILPGTPAGVGHGLDPPRYLGADDVVACEIEGLGRIENRVMFR